MKVSAFALAAFAAGGLASAQSPKWTPLNGSKAKPAPAQVAPTQQPLPTETVAPPPQAAAARPGEEMLTNQAIISLVSAGLGPDTIVAKISASRGTYDTSTNALIQLKQANVPDAVIAAMVNRSKSPVMANATLDNSNPDPLAPHSPGIYVLDPRGSGQMLKIDPTVSNQTKTSNILGYAFTYGLSSAKLKTVIPNPSARVHAFGTHPSFYFFFNQSSALASIADFSTGFSAAATSPNEFSLVRLQQKGDHREAVIGSLGFASAKSGISDKARMAFTYDEVAPGVFKVTPSVDLQPGEYGFVYSVTGSTTIARIFDFSVS
jgi:hypothetical protein